MQCGAVQCHAVKCPVVQCSAVHYSVQYSNRVVQHCSSVASGPGGAPDASETCKYSQPGTLGAGQEESQDRGEQC